VIPIHLTELSPGSFRTFVVGTTYQLGNLASSASSTIEAKLGERFPLPPIRDKKGDLIKRYNYGKVICIFMGAVYAYVILLTFIGPERRARDLTVEHDTDMAEVTHKHIQHHGEGAVGVHKDVESDEYKAAGKRVEML